eukprot:6180769-Pleurochrysis_carterae.AAC.2
MLASRSADVRKSSQGKLQPVPRTCVRIVCGGAMSPGRGAALKINCAKKAHYSALNLTSGRPHCSEHRGRLASFSVLCSYDLHNMR